MLTNSFSKLERLLLPLPDIRAKPREGRILGRNPLVPTPLSVSTAAALRAVVEGLNCARRNLPYIQVLSAAA